MATASSLKNNREKFVRVFISGSTENHFEHFEKTILIELLEIVVVKRFCYKTLVHFRQLKN